MISVRDCGTEIKEKETKNPDQEAKNATKPNEDYEPDINETAEYGGDVAGGDP